MDRKRLVDELNGLIVVGDPTALDGWLTSLSSADRDSLGGAVEAREAPRMPEEGNHPTVSEPRAVLCARAVLALARTGSTAADRMFWRAAEIDPVVLLATVVSRGREWAEQFVLAALAAESTFRWERREVPVLCLPLIVHLGIRPPVTPGLIQAWGEYYRMSAAKWNGTFIDRGTTPRLTQPWFSTDGDILVRDYKAEGLDFAAVCRLDPLFGHVAPHWVTRPLFVPHEELRPVAHLPPVLAALVDEGIVAREEAADEALTRLAANPRPAEQQYLARILRALRVGPADLADRHALALSIISAGHGSASAALLGPLLGSDVTDEDLEELAFVVFARKEKKQRSQLMSYLARAVKAVTAGPAERAAPVHGRETLVAALGAAAELDDLQVSRRATELLEALGAVSPVPPAVSDVAVPDLWDSLPPAAPVGPQPLFGAGVEAFTAAFSAVSARPGGAGEEALLACFVASAPHDVEGIRRFFASTDRERASGAGLVSRNLMERLQSGWSPEQHGELVAELKRVLPVPEGPRSWAGEWYGITPAGALLEARLSEAQLLAPHVPCLLSTPSLENGVVTFEDLLSRLRAYNSARACYGELDLLLALLRLEPVPPERANELAGFIVPRASAPRDARYDGVTLAHSWVATGGLPPLASELWVGPPVPDPYGRKLVRMRGKETVVRVDGTAVTLPVALSNFPSASATLFLGVGESDNHSVVTWNDTANLAASVVPSWRDLTASYWLENCRAELKDGPRLLAGVARCTGPAGPVTHLALAHGLSAPAPDSRQRAVDAALEIIGQRAFSAESFRDVTVAMQGTGELTPGRFAAACEQIALAGALSAVWSALSGLATVLMAQPKVPTGTADVLAVLRRHCASVPVDQLGIEGLGEFAARRGNGKALTEARALHAALADLAGTGVRVGASPRTARGIPSEAAS